MPSLKKLLPLLSILFLFLLKTENATAQTNFLLNGNFEDINTCTEYSSECGVEAWFYLKDVKAQMLTNSDSLPAMGANSFGLFYNWLGYKDFTPVIGTILPCRLQKDKRYTFKGMIKATLNGRLAFKPGIAIGEKFYVPKRPFSATMHPDSITDIHRVKGSAFYEFEYSFLATGNEKYLTFGTYIEEDTTSGKRTFIGTQSVALVLDNFQLLAADINEAACIDLVKNKQEIYSYNFRHKEMDYSLFGRGELNIVFDGPDSNYTTRLEIPKKVKTDTLKLGDVLFDFNKADLKPAALKLLRTYFSQAAQQHSIDSIYVEGHTDSIGSDARNLQLSQQRCQRVQDWLRENVLTKDKIQVHPFGKTKPIASNSTAQGRALNRRVEMIIFRKVIKTE